MRRLSLLILLLLPLTAHAGMIDDLENWIDTKITDFITWLYETLKVIWQGISDFVKSMWDVFLDLCKSFLLTVLDLLKDFLAWMFDQFFTLIEYLLHGLDSMLASLDFTPYLSLPPEVSNIMGLIGVGSAVSMIVGSLLIRFVLQLIPFTRLGS